MQDCSCDNTSRINPTLDLHCVVKKFRRRRKLRMKRKLSGMKEWTGSWCVSDDRSPSGNRRCDCGFVTVSKISNRSVLRYLAPVIRLEKVLPYPDQVQFELIGFVQRESGDRVNDNWKRKSRFLLQTMQEVAASDVWVYRRYGITGNAEYYNEMPELHQSSGIQRYKRTPCYREQEA